MNNTDLSHAVVVSDGKVTTTSLKIAEVFGKLHKDVLKVIESLQVPDNWHKRNFAPMQIDRKIGNGATRKDKAYSITRDGFTLLVMGFTGAAAMRFKIAYLEEFNRMEAELRRLQDGISVQPELPLSDVSAKSALSVPRSFLPEAVYRGVPVISLPRLAQQLRVTPNQIHGALHNNRAGLIENTELFRVKGGYALRAAGCGNVFGRRTHLLNLFTESGAAKIRAYLFPDLPAPAPAIAAEPLPQVKAELPLPGLDIPRLTRSRGVITITGADFRRKLAERELDAEKLLRKLSAAGYDVETAMVEVAYLRDLSRRFCDQAELIRENLLRAESGANRLCNLSLNAVYRFGRGGGIGTGETVFA